MNQSHGIVGNIHSSPMKLFATYISVPWNCSQHTFQSHEIVRNIHPSPMKLFAEYIPVPWNCSYNISDSSSCLRDIFSYLHHSGFLHRPMILFAEYISPQSKQYPRYSMEDLEPRYIGSTHPDPPIGESSSQLIMWILDFNKKNFK